ncbi:MAG: hypothetical protein F6J98_02015 [Moorea sp. SIO4G2]|nr:hypothetical protein [Moorena sp. SIO4G2]
MNQLELIKPKSWQARGVTFTYAPVVVEQQMLGAIASFKSKSGHEINGFLSNHFLTKLKSIEDWANQLIATNSFNFREIGYSHFFTSTLLAGIYLNPVLDNYVSFILRYSGGKYELCFLGGNKDGADYLGAREQMIDALEVIKPFNALGQIDLQQLKLDGKRMKELDQILPGTREGVLASLNIENQTFNQMIQENFAPGYIPLNKSDLSSEMKDLVSSLTESEDWQLFSGKDKASFGVNCVFSLKTAMIEDVEWFLTKRTKKAKVLAIAPIDWLTKDAGKKLINQLLALSDVAIATGWGESSSLLINLEYSAPFSFFDNQQLKFYLKGNHE